ncbi:MAG TPA: dTDP-4-dehydrorhamnose reductase [Ilumatobacteraceae bacterium]|jgi:dTDP-4-dehydrorhamnose reductase|nr:dTDP-4-dehydrorhamnose reductase [Ilumatobacteraceae bacterium]
MRVLITGASGQLGIDLVRCCESAGDDVVATGHTDLDVSDRDAVHGAVSQLRPDAVINCAAWTAVDACEGDPDRAFAQNGLAVRWLAESCDNAGARLVQISTDYVFDGLLDRPYTEWDDPSPQSVYGASKLAGEREAMALGPSAAVVRTSWVCSENGSNMVRTIMKLANERPELAFVSDQSGHPTFTADLAPMVRRIAVDRRSGIHHVTNQTATTWYGFARDVVEAMGKDPDMVRAITTDELQPPRPAPRPANSVLDNAVLRLAGIPLLRDYIDPLRETVKALL